VGQFSRAAKTLLAKCREKGLSRVVVALGTGSVQAPDSDLGVVQYVIFELAEEDVRGRRDRREKFNTAGMVNSQPSRRRDDVPILTL